MPLHRPLRSLLAVSLSVLAVTAVAAPVNYTIDPDHTYPSFEADHGGLSTWRGKFNKTAGTIVLDRAAKTGSLDITIDATSLDFGYDKLNTHAKGPDMFDVEQYPTAVFKSNAVTFHGKDPVAVAGELTLHGVTKPVTLAINKFKCIMHPMLKREVCGADASANFNRSDFGIGYGVQMGFSPVVKLAIQVEAVKQ